jgi:hypothetical protein
MKRLNDGQIWALLLVVSALTALAGFFIKSGAA